MAYNTNALLKDAQGKPIPQYYNDVLDSYEAEHGSGGSMMVMVCDATGTPITQQTVLDSMTANANAIIAKLDELILVVS